MVVKTILVSHRLSISALTTFHYKHCNVLELYAAMEKNLSLPPLHFVVVNEAIRGPYLPSNNSKKICSEGHAKILNDIAKHEILGAISNIFLPKNRLR